MDAKLFQDPKIEEHIDLKSEFGISNASPKIFIPSQYFCGFPVPKGNARKCVIFACVGKSCYSIILKIFQIPFRSWISTKSHRLNSVSKGRSDSDHW